MRGVLLVAAAVTALSCTPKTPPSPTPVKPLAPPPPRRRLRSKHYDWDRARCTQNKSFKVRRK